MIHVTQNFVGVIYDLATSDTLNVRDKADPTIVVLVARIIQPARFRSPIRWSKRSWILIAADVFHGFVPYVVFRMTRANARGNFWEPSLPARIQRVEKPSKLFPTNRSEPSAQRVRHQEFADTQIGNQFSVVDK